jgi:phage baseplate assembly protein W
MAFGAKKIFPIDTKPGTAVGVAIPFNAPAVFFSTYTTKDAIRNNILNFLLTNKQERYLNNNFGANIRALLFEQITSNNLDNLKNIIQDTLSQYFINVAITNIDITGDPDINSVKINITFNIINTNIVDQIEITLE